MNRIYTKGFAQVSESYSVCYPNPIKVSAGERVSIEKWETKSEWKGWAFCVDSRGVKGWVSEKYLQVTGNAAIATSDYDATELAIEQGSFVQIHRDEFGWAWVENSEGSQGWVPLSILPYMFKPMAEDDLPLLFRWASEPHVKRWWGTEEHWTDFRNRYVANIQSEDSFPFIAYFQGKPIGYLNYWDVEGDPNFAGLFPAGAVGTDQFIGEAEFIGKGHGSKLVRSFTSWLLINGAPLVMTDPDPANKAAVRCYEKAGFTSLRTVDTSEGQVLLMERRK